MPRKRPFPCNSIRNPGPHVEFTTLARACESAQGYAHFCFDDDAIREAAQAAPIGFMAELGDRVILDEVQRVLELFTALKLAVDQDRRPGRFLLIGSANELLVPKLTDSSAVRMEVLRVHPLSQCELAGTASGFRSLRRLARAAGSKFVGGVILYNGETTARCAKRLHAAPIRTLWEQ